MDQTQPPPTPSPPPPPPPPQSDSPANKSPSETVTDSQQCESTEPIFDRNEIFKALEIVERDSMSIADSYISLFSSLRLFLSEVTNSSVEHMHCFSDAAGRLQVSGPTYMPYLHKMVTGSDTDSKLTSFLYASILALDAATKGSHYINSCLRLNEEMKSVESLALQLKILRKNVDSLDSAVNKIIRFP